MVSCSQLVIQYSPLNYLLRDMSCRKVGCSAINGFNFLQEVRQNLKKNAYVVCVKFRKELSVVRKVWSLWEFYLLFALFALYVYPNATQFLSHFARFVQVFLNVLRWPVAQESIILCLKVMKISDFNSIPL
jgi:hypothetical protein